MIYTLTLNPSIDYFVSLDKFVPGITNRTLSEEYYIGGKGINVSCILSELGMSSTALGFIAGFIGEAIENGLRKNGIHSDMIRLKEGISRINVKIKTDVESDINGQGPRVTEEDFSRLLQRTDVLKSGDIIVLAGSIPKNISEDVYERILQRIEWRDIGIVVDAEKALLLNCLRYRPFLIKPNKQELCDLFGREISGEKEIAAAAAELKSKGARNVLVSLGGEGALLFAEDGNVYRSGIISGKAINTVGCGDSMIAGFIAGYERTHDYEFAMKLGAACGNATAFSPGLGGIEMINDILGKL